MEKLRFNLHFLIVLAFVFSAVNSAKACDRSALVLNGISPLANNQYSITMTFSCGAGQTGFQVGGDQPTGSFAFFVAGGAQVVSYPGSLVSPNTGAVYPGVAMFNDTVLFYDNQVEWWACIDPSCGGVQTVSQTITIVTQGMPTSIYLAGMEGAGSPNGCVGLDMTIDFTCGSFAANAGPDKTVYPAYVPAACATLTASATGGSGPFTYLWSTGATTASINVCPSATTTYTVTVTNTANGCVSSDAVTVFSENITCGNNKIYVCQNGSTRCVPRPQVAGLLANGATLGSCKNKQGEVAEELFETSLSVAPNPASGMTRLTLSLDHESSVNVSMFDMTGKQVRQILNGVAARGEREIEIGLDGLTPGLYFVRMSAEGQTYSTKVVVQ